MMTKQEIEKTVNAMGKTMEITFSGYSFDIYIKDRKTGKIINAYLDVEPAFAGVFMNELLEGWIK